jgi:hypothetical protein
MNKNVCYECGKEFKEGEIIISDSEGNRYHSGLDHEGAPIDCFIKSILKKQPINPNSREIYYKKDFYPLPKEIVCPEIETGFFLNDAKTGHILLGNLEKLTKNE